MKVLLGAAAAALVGVMTLACNSGGDSMTLEEYFTQLETVEADAEARFNEIEDPFGGAESASLDDRKKAIRDGFADFRTIFDDYREQYDELDPPDEAADLHRDYNDVQDDFIEEFAKYIDGFQDAQTEEEFDAAAESTLADPELERAADLCAALEELASDNSIEVDLRCTDE